MGEAKEWGKALGELIRSGGTRTSKPTPEGKQRDTSDDDSSYDDDSHTHSSRCPDDCDK